MIRIDVKQIIRYYIRELREANAFSGLSIRDMIETGRQ